MGSPIISSIITILIGIVLFISGGQFSKLFNLASSTVSVPGNIMGDVGLFQIFGIFLIGVGGIFFIFSIVFAILQRKRKQKQEERKPQQKEVYVCPFCNAKFDYEDDLQTHVQQAHDEEAQTMEQAGINWRGEGDE